MQSVFNLEQPVLHLFIICKLGKKSIKPITEEILIHTQPSDGVSLFTRGEFVRCVK